ncbi:MAG: hypothetical protein ACLFUH_01050 [Bacteroidales bacterium]
MLPTTHLITGYFYDENGCIISGATITASSVTGNEDGIETTTTTSTGYYQINVQNICNEGDLIEIQFQDGADIHRIASEFIRVNLDSLTQEVNATFENQFEVNTNTYSFYLPILKWNGIQSQLQKNTKLFNFKTNEISTVDMDINSEDFTLEGYFYVDIYSRQTISGKVEAIINIQNNSEEITIYDINTNVNYAFVIKNFTFYSIKSSPKLFAYTLNLEFVKTYDTPI